MTHSEDGTATYMVRDEESLGYLHDPENFWPLSSKAGGPSWVNGAVPTQGHNMRAATKKDFQEYRVSDYAVVFD